MALNAPPDGTHDSSHERVLRLVLMIAICFALASLGFFLAVLLQHSAPPAAPVVDTIQPVATDTPSSITMKLETLHQLGQSDAVDVSTSSTPGATSTAQSQASNTEEQIALKLKMLHSVGAH